MGLKIPFLMSGEEFVQKKISFVCGVLNHCRRGAPRKGKAIWLHWHKMSKMDTSHFRPKGHHSQHNCTISSPLLFDCATSHCCVTASALMCFLNRRIRQLQAIFTPATASYIIEFRKHCWISNSELQKSYGWVTGLMNIALIAVPSLSSIIWRSHLKCNW